MKRKNIFTISLILFFSACCIAAFTFLTSCSKASPDTPGQNTKGSDVTVASGTTPTPSDGSTSKLANQVTPTQSGSSANTPPANGTVSPDPQLSATPGSSSVIPKLDVPTRSWSEIEKAVKSIVIDPVSDKSAKTTPLARFEKIDFNNRIFRPVYNTNVMLYAASLPQKPDAKPTSSIIKNPPNIDINISKYAQSAFIDSTSNTVRWFSFTKNPSIKPSKYIWQVSLAPFNGSGGDQINPKGLLSSGEIVASSNEFSIDFSKATSTSKLSIITKIPNSILASRLSLPVSTTGAPPVQKTYYVRVLPLDSRGKVIGDGGTGIPIIYGKPYTKSSINKIFLQPFDLQSTLHQGNPSFKEFPNDFSYSAIRSMDSTNSSQFYCFLPAGYVKDATNLVLQVAKAPFTSSWETTPGLVYEIQLNSGEDAFNKLSKFDPIKVDFTKFAPPNSQLTDKEKLKYYIRVVALRPGKDIGTVNSYFSKTVAVEYGRPNVQNVTFYENKKIDAKLPQITKYSYTPISWEANDWKYRYVVVRQPLESEVFKGIGSDKPFDLLKVGTKLDFTPHPEDKSWWEEAIGAIKSFFEDLAGFVTDLTNWIASTYSSLKSGLIEFVANNLPLVPDSLRGALKSALEALVDYGLASIGIPPTLPNFDDLANMGTDYLATLAMETAGVPANDYLKDGLVDLSKGIGNGVSSSTKTGSPNPMGWDFIKSDPDFMYKPAYVMIELYNPYDSPTPQGYITASNEFIINTGKTLSQSEQYLYAAFGGNVYYQTFTPVSGQKIPSLAPKQRLTIPVFLEENIGKPFWSYGPKIDKDKYRMIYNNLGKYDFYINLNFQLPSISEVVKEQKLPSNAIYSYNATSLGIHFTTEPYVPYSK